MSTPDNFFIDIQLLRNTEQHIQEVNAQRQQAERTDKSTIIIVFQ
jgi:hypothetical protein